MNLLSFLFRYSLRYMRYYWRAKTRFDIHSPFVSHFLAQTLDDRRWFYAFDELQLLREKLVLNDDPITVVDYGAGSQLGPHATTTINRLARHSALSPSAGRLLFRIAHFLKPKVILELGTSLGISALYQLAAAPQALLITIEGNPEAAALARKNFREAGRMQAQVLEGSFREVLPGIIRSQPSVDFFHFDGDHRYQPTLDYFEQCLEICTADSVFCIGDIYWSRDMERAWRKLQQHPRVRLSIDTFHFGLLFLRPEQREKQHFTLIASRCKPWRMGIW